MMKKRIGFTDVRSGGRLATAVIKTALRKAVPGLVAAWIGMTALPAGAQSDAGNVKQAVGKSVYFGVYPQTKHASLLATAIDVAGTVTVTPPSAGVPYVIKHNYRDQGADPLGYAPTAGQGRSTYFLVEPVKWKVLAFDAQGLLLVSEKNLTQGEYDAAGALWSASSIRTYLNGTFLIDATTEGTIVPFFGVPEQNALVTSYLTNPAYNGNADGVHTNDRVFLLSREEATPFLPFAAVNTDYAASFPETSDPGVGDYWYLRSRGDFQAVAFVQKDGTLYTFGAATGAKKQLRPALRLDESAVVLVSASKDNTVGDDPLAAALSASDLKLTLVSPALALTAAPASLLVSGSPLTISYSAVSTGTNRYVSCVVEEQGGDAKYYMKLADASSVNAGTVSPDLSSIPDGSYTLKLFVEEINADPQQPDYASQPVVFFVGKSAAAEAPAFTTLSLPDATGGLPYTEAIAVTGSPAPRFEISGGALPAGIVLREDGTLEGTPTAFGAFTFTVDIDNGAGSASQSYSLTVEAVSAPAITTPPGALTGAVIGDAYSFQLTATGSPAPVFSLVAATDLVAASTLPAGLALSAAGEITGTPTAEGTVNFSVTATNFTGTDIQTFSIAVAATGTPVAPQITAPAAGPLPEAVVGKPYSFAGFAATGDPAPGFSVVGPLPPGLSINIATGEIYGTPTVAAANVPVVISVSNGVPPDATGTYILTIEERLLPPVLSPLTLTAGSAPFTVNVTFEREVSGFTAADITTLRGTASNVRMVSAPTATTPPRADVWAFDLTPDASLADGETVEAYVRTNTALDIYGKRTFDASSAVVATYAADRPFPDFGALAGFVFDIDPGTFSFTITPYASSPDLFVDGAPLSSANIGSVIGLSRDGVPVSGWDATVNGNTVTINGIFGAGTYTVALEGNRISNVSGIYMGARSGQFVILGASAWYDGCEQTVTLAFVPSPVSRQVALGYTGLAADAFVTPPATLTLPANASTANLTLLPQRVSDAREGETGEIVVSLAGSTPYVLTGLKFFNRPENESLIFIPPTTLYAGYLTLLNGGSPRLERSLDGGLSWHDAWTAATIVEISNIGDDIRFREPAGCYETVIRAYEASAISYTVQREVILPRLPGLTTDPAGGGYVHSGADFVFTLTLSGAYEGMKPDVLTGRQHVPDSIGVIVTPLGNGSFEVRIRAVREPLTVDFRMVELETGNAAVDAARVWTSDGQLYIAALHDGAAKVYTPAGGLVRTVALVAGQTARTALGKGFYIVSLSDGSVFKVSGF